MQLMALVCRLCFRPEEESDSSGVRRQVRREHKTLL